MTYNSTNTVAIMQPYVFPYIGYYQLVDAVNHFVFYDDVNFIKRGWVNRNKILINNSEKLISFPCIKASQNKLINEVGIRCDDIEYNKILNSIKLAYSKAPYFDKVFPLIERVFSKKCENISEFAINSVKDISNYLSIDTKFYRSSTLSPESRGLDREDRLILITKQLKGDRYINAIGGKSIYSKSDFAKKGIDLFFLESKNIRYKQFDNNFIDNLSIIDVLMFNSIEDVRAMLKLYSLN